MALSSMLRTWQQVFIEHPKSVNETYFQHMRFATWFAFRLFAAFCAALAHAFIPCLFEKTASRMINEMHNRLHNR